MLASLNTEYPSIMIIYERWRVHKLKSKCVAFNVFVQLEKSIVYSISLLSKIASIKKFNLCIRPSGTSNLTAFCAANTLCINPLRRRVTIKSR